MLPKIYKQGMKELHGKVVEDVRASKGRIVITFAGTPTTYLGINNVTPGSVQTGTIEKVYRLKTAAERKAEGLPPLKMYPWKGDPAATVLDRVKDQYPAPKFRIERGSAKKGYDYMAVNVKTGKTAAYFADKTGA